MLLGQAQPFASPMEALAHISETPWSNWTKADYTLEQWHAACLIHTHDGEPTSKSECKLPVKTPDGALNRNGVHAAAAALAGARGGLKGVSDEQKKKAAAALRRYYAQLDEEPPESLTQSAIDFREKSGTPEEIVEHYGVKGMQWGVRKKEETGEQTSAGKVTPPPLPKPLSARKQRRVDKFLERADVADTKISALKLSNQKLEGTKNLAKRYQRYINKQDIKELDKAQSRALKDAEAVKKGKLTSTQKKMIIGGVAVGAIAAGYMVYRGQQSGALNSYKLLAQARLGGKKAPFKVNKELSGPMSASDLLKKVARPVNPLYSSPGGHMNCRRSTYAYELRRRGFDVRATTSSEGWGQSESGVINALTTEGKDFFRKMSMSEAVSKTGGSTVARGDTRINPVPKILLKGLDVRNTDRYEPGYASKKVFEALAKQPNGARGEVLFKFPRFGHSMAWEIVDGRPHVFDSQKGTFHDLTKLVEDKWGNFDGAEITRLDNVDLDLNFLTRWATNRG